MIADLLFRNDGVFDFVFQKLIAGKHREIAVQRSLLLVAALLPIGFGQPGRPEQRSHRQQFHGIEKAAFFSAFQGVGDVFYPRKRRAALQPDEAGGVLGLLLQLFTLGQRSLGPKLPAQFLCRGRGRFRRQQLQNFGQLDGGQRFFL